MRLGQRDGSAEPRAGAQSGGHDDRELKSDSTWTTCSHHRAAHGLFLGARSWISFLPAEAQQRRPLTNGATVSAARLKPLLPGQPGHQPYQAAHINGPHRRSRLAHARRSAGGVRVRERAAFSQHACPASCAAAGGAAAPQDEVSRVAQCYACACVCAVCASREAQESTA